MLYLQDQQNRQFREIQLQNNASQNNKFPNLARSHVRRYAMNFQYALEGF